MYSTCRSYWSVVKQNLKFKVTYCAFKFCLQSILCMSWKYLNRIMHNLSNLYVFNYRPFVRNLAFHLYVIWFEHLWWLWCRKINHKKLQFNNFDQILFYFVVTTHKYILAFINTTFTVNMFLFPDKRYHNLSVLTYCRV